ncbi:MAG TPA: RNA polymerase sigma factor [Gaiellaceae bacterium]|jgi:RNA polymerase sigma factor (sigma-70 family)|nr:RNA polymerase sigma factor [Gaiellaceae bacterium]
MVVASGDVRLPRLLRREAGAEVDRLYRRYADEVLRYALLVLRSRTDAEDITQTVFLRALRAIERGEKVRTPRNWLITITHNECRRLLATRKVHSELPDEVPVEPAEQGRAEELKVALAALPATQRQALVLRELEGRTYVEIARTLDLSVSAVETLIFRARRALREQIENAVSCEEFAALLDDPSARSRVRAHARVCAACATLDHQARGRKSALKRIVSALGLPWWGAKLAAVAVTVAAVAAVAAPHDGTRPNPPLNLIPPSKHLSLPPAPAGGTRFKSFAPKHPHARPVAAAPKQVPHTAAVPAPAVTTPAPPPPEPPQPADPPLPPPPVVPATTVPAAPPVAVAQTVLPPTPEVPTVTVPTVSVPVPAPASPTVALPVEVPKVSLP